MPISSWVKKMIERVNGQDGEDGAEIIVDQWPLMLRLARFIRDRKTFLPELTALVERHEADLWESQGLVDRLKNLKYPSLTGKNWKSQLHTWMQMVYDALHELERSPRIVVPEPPELNRSQRRLLNRYRLRLFYVPAWSEEEFPKEFVKLVWKDYLKTSCIQRIALPGIWVAFETIRKPNYEDGEYPDDRLVADIGLDTRFNHPHLGKGEGDDLVEDILPKVARLLEPLDGQTRIQPAEIFNFLGNLFNWLTVYTTDVYPDLGSTNSAEWCENRYDSRFTFVVGRSDGGGLEYVSENWSNVHSVRFAFRFLVQFSLQDS